jgi:hypothetical protein
MLDGLFDKFRTGDFSTGEAIATVLGSGLAGFGLAKAGGALPTAGLLSGLTGGYQQGRERQAQQVNATLDYDMRRAALAEARRRDRTQVLREVARVAASLDDPSDYLRSMRPVLREYGINPEELEPRDASDRGLQRTALSAWERFKKNAPTGVDLADLEALDAQFTLTVRGPGGVKTLMKPSEVFALATGLTPTVSGAKLPTKAPAGAGSDTPEEKVIANALAIESTRLGRDLTPEEDNAVRLRVRAKWTQADDNPTLQAIRSLQLEQARNRQNPNLPPASQRRVDVLSDQFTKDPTVKRRQVMAEAVAFVNALSDTSHSPADDQAMIYAFAKVMDPESVVREGEYATVQKYAQSWLQAFGFNAARIVANSEFLTPQARQQLKKTIRTKFAAGDAAYTRIRQAYAAQINRVTQGGDGDSYLIDFPGVVSATPSAAGGAKKRAPIPGIPGAEAEQQPDGRWIRVK